MRPVLGLHIAALLLGAWASARILGPGSEPIDSTRVSALVEGMRDDEAAVVATGTIERIAVIAEKHDRVASDVAVGASSPSIVGVVRDAESGAPIVAAEVTLRSKATRRVVRSMQTDEHGGYALDLADTDDRHELVVRVPACVERRFDLPSVPGEGGEVAFDPEVSRAGRWLGRIVDLETHEGVAGMSVSLECPGRGSIAETNSRADGRFEIDGIAEIDGVALSELGTIDVVVHATANGGSSSRLSTRTRFSTADLRAGESEVPIWRSRTVSGRVLDSRGMPIRFAYLEVMPPSPDSFASLAVDWLDRARRGSAESITLADPERSIARTDEHGRFVLEGIAPLRGLDATVLPYPTSEDCPRLTFALPDPAVCGAVEWSVGTSPPEGTRF